MVLHMDTGMRIQSLHMPIRHSDCFAARAVAGKTRRLKFVLGVFKVGQFHQTAVANEQEIDDERLGSY